MWSSIFVKDIPEAITESDINDAFKAGLSLWFEV